MFSSNCVFYGICIFLITSGIVISVSWPFIFNYIRWEKLKLGPSSETYKLWKKTPIPMYLDVYLFNWTNSEAFMRDRTLKPEFEEIGPFVFKEVHDRVNITWNNNGTVAYNQTRTWFFVSEESVNINTPITNLNVILTTVTRMASTYKDIYKLLLDFLTLVYKEKLLITRPANEWLFDGISDELLQFIKTFINVPYDKFGWFYGRNLSSVFDGRFNVKTGEDDIYNLGEMDTWNFVNKTHFYGGECGIIKGSSGELLSPLSTQQSNLSIFITDFCGPLTLQYAGLKEVEGLTGYHYVGDKSVFDDGNQYPTTKCFCTGECSPSGVRNVTSCRKAPLFISFPHFYLANSSYTDAVVGVNPNKSEHEFYINIDPLTGIPLEVRAQIQLNVLLQPMKLFPVFENVPKVYIPMMWFRQRAKVTPDLASKGRSLQMLGKIGLVLCISLTFLVFLVLIIRICVVKLHNRRKYAELVNTLGETMPDNVDDSNQ